VDKQKNTA